MSSSMDVLSLSPLMLAVLGVITGGCMVALLVRWALDVRRERQWDGRRRDH